MKSMIVCSMAILMFAALSIEVHAAKHTPPPSSPVENVPDSHWNYCTPEELANGCESTMASLGGEETIPPAQPYCDCPMAPPQLKCRKMGLAMECN